MILLSVKSADPTLIDLRSPEISPPPSGLELPHAAVMRTIKAARKPRCHLRVIDIPRVLSAHSFNGHYRHVWRLAALYIQCESNELFHYSADRAKMHT